jgi:hypothetical protein
MLKDGFIDYSNEKQYDYLIEIKNLQVDKKTFLKELQDYIYGLELEEEITYYIEDYFKQHGIKDYTIDYLYNLDEIYY